jgi:hypothetical protein
MYGADLRLICRSKKAPPEAGQILRGSNVIPRNRVYRIDFLWSASDGGSCSAVRTNGEHDMHHKQSRHGSLSELHSTRRYGGSEHVYGRKHECGSLNIDDTVQRLGSAERIYDPCVWYG